MRVILAGGGTGGHVIPAVAIAHELRTRYQAEVCFVGTGRGMESRIVPAAGYELRLIEVGALKKVWLGTRLKTLTGLPRAVWRAYGILAEFKPDVVIGVGGYASGPTMLAAFLCNIPSLAFEPNRVPGLANRLVGVMASAAAVQFEQTCHYFQNCQVTGIPVRHAFFEAAIERRAACPAAAGAPASAAVALAGVGAAADVGGASVLRPSPSATATAALAGADCGESLPPTLLVFGGSQGAHSINHALLEALPALTAALPGIHVIHQTGERDYPPLPRSA